MGRGTSPHCYPEVVSSGQEVAQEADLEEEQVMIGGRLTKLSTEAVTGILLQDGVAKTVSTGEVEDQEAKQQKVQDEGECNPGREGSGGNNQDLAPGWIGQAATGQWAVLGKGDWWEIIFTDSVLGEGSMVSTTA